MDDLVPIFKGNPGSDREFRGRCNVLHEGRWDEPLGVAGGGRYDCTDRVALGATVHGPRHQQETAREKRHHD